VRLQEVAIVVQDTATRYATPYRRAKPLLVAPRADRRSPHPVYRALVQVRADSTGSSRAHCQHGPVCVLPAGAAADHRCRARRLGCINLPAAGCVCKHTLVVFAVGCGVQPEVPRRPGFYLPCALVALATACFARTSSTMRAVYPAVSPSVVPHLALVTVCSSAAVSEVASPGRLHAVSDNYKQGGLGERATPSSALQRVLHISYPARRIALLRHLRMPCYRRCRGIDVGLRCARDCCRPGRSSIGKRPLRIRALRVFNFVAVFRSR